MKSAGALSIAQSKLDLARVIDQFERPLLHYAKAIVGHAAAEDVVQDVFLKLCKAPFSDIETRLVGWLFTVCRNEAISYRRRNRAAIEMEESTAAADSQKGPEVTASKREISARVTKIFDQMSESKREIVSLRFSAGLSYKEISSVTNLSVNHIGVLIHEAMKEMRGALDDPLPEGGNSK